MSGSFIKSAEATNDAVNKMGKSLQASFAIVLEALLPTLKQGAEFVVEFSKSFGEFAKAHPMLVKLAAGVGAVTLAISVLGGPVTAAIAGVAALVLAWNKFKDPVLDALKSVKDAFDGFIDTVLNAIFPVRELMNLFGDDESKEFA